MSAAHDSPPPRRRSSNLALPYAISILIGSVSVFLAPEVAWPIPVILMLVYLGFGLAKAQQEGLTLEFSDSFYYLGFTLTIASLLASLKPFGQKLPEPDTILKYFGLGLLTTVLGVVGRTVLQMFYRTPDENLERTNQRIEQEAQRYLGNLEQLNSTTRDVLGRTLGGLDKDLESGLRNIEGSLTQLNDRLKRATSDVEQIRIDPSGLRQSFTTLSGVVQEAAGSLRVQLSSLETAQQAVAEACEASRKALLQHTSRLGESQDTFARGVTAVLQDVQSLGQKVAAIDVDPSQVKTALTRLAELIEGGVAPITTGLGKVGDAASALSDRVREVQSSVSGLNVSELTKAIGSVSEANRQLEAAIKQNEAANRSSATALRGILAASNKRAEDLNRTIGEIIEAVHVKLEELDLANDGPPNVR